ncbi:MAG: TonB-dependent receptor, partial [Gemmatirosa sp.]
TGQYVARVRSSSSVVRPLVALLLLAGAAGAQPPRDAPPTPPAATGAVRGIVLSDRGGEPLPRAAVTIERAGAPAGRALRRAVTDDGGAFLATGLPAGAVVVHARALGHRPTTREITVRAGDTVVVRLSLAPAAQTLAAVQARERVGERARFEQLPEVGQVTITGRTLRALPSIGEPDVLRTAQLMAGVVARNDFSAGYNVRGGESDQNLVLLDGIPVYNPFHLGGLFGTFVDQAVAGVDLSVGGFPAEYGGRLSSVLDVRPKAEERRGVHGAAQVSLVSTSGAFGGAFGRTTDGDARTSWNVAARRTYLDALVGALSDRSLPYHFQDAQAHVTHRVGSGTLALTGYVGSDVLDGSFTQFDDSARAGGGDFAFTWGNALAGLTWRQPLPALARRVGRADSAELVQRASVTRFSTTLDLGDGTVRFVNDVTEARAAGQLSASGAFGGRHTARVGYEVSRVSVTYDAGSNASTADLFALRQQPTVLAAYVDDTWRVHPRLLARVGARLEGVPAAHWGALSPRASVRWFATPDLAITLAGGQYTQAMHAVRNEDAPVRIFDFWVGSDRYVRPSRSTHLVLGAERWMGALAFARVEAWGKGFADIPEPNDGDDPSVRGDEFNRLRGRAYGVDVMLRRLEGGPVAGWVAYGYAVSTRAPAGASAGASGLSFLRAGEFWPAQDRRHTLNVVGTWRVGRSWVTSARFGFGSGTPFTDIEGQLVRRVYDGMRNSWDTGTRARDPEAVGGLRNGSRYPVFHRLDLGLSRSFQRGATTWTPSLSLVNAYNRQNTFVYSFDYAAQPPTRQAVSQFPLLPSVGLAVEF